MSRSIREGLNELRGRLAAAGIENAAREARRIMAAALEIAPDRLSLVQPDALPPAAEDRLNGLSARRCAREPLSHILGFRAFYEHEFQVTADVLDPRPETEILVRLALDLHCSKVLDLGTGSGCILGSILAARPSAMGVGTDISPEALELASRNAHDLGVGERAQWVLADWFDGVTGRYDLIVSNPPYIAASEMGDLAPELSFEPRHALTDEGDGLRAYRTILKDAFAYVAPGGAILLEIGPTQGAQVMAMMVSGGFSNVRVHEDLDGRDRVVMGYARKTD